MAAGNFIWYAEGIRRIATQELDWVNDTIKALLLDNSYTPDRNAHVDIGDLTPNEIADGDYARQTLGTKSISQDASTPKKTQFVAAAIDFGNAVTISARYLALVVDSGVEATSYAIGYVDLNSGGSTPVASTSDDFDISFPGGVIARLAP